MQLYRKLLIINNQVKKHALTTQHVNDFERNYKRSTVDLF